MIDDQDPQTVLKEFQDLMDDEDVFYLLSDQLAQNLGEISSITGARLDLVVYTVMDTLKEMEL